MGVIHHVPPTVFGPLRVVGVLPLSIFVGTA